MSSDECEKISTFLLAYIKKHFKATPGKNKFIKASLGKTKNVNRLSCRAVNYWDLRVQGPVSPSPALKGLLDSPEHFTTAEKVLYWTRKSTGTRESKGGESTSPKVGLVPALVWGKNLKKSLLWPLVKSSQLLIASGIFRY